MASQQTPATTSFNGGELSPLMAGRVDTAIYEIGAALMENFAPCIEGPMQKCPGFARIRAAAASATWLSRFVFNDTQAYVLEGLADALRFYTNGGRIEADPDTPYEVAVPYAATDWPFVSMQQSYDRLYMARAGYPPAALTRTTATTFAYAALALTNGPFKDGNTDKTVTVSASGVLTTGGTITITASAALFQAGHVGGLFRIEAKDFSDIPAWEAQSGSNTVGVTKRRSDGKVYLCDATSSDNRTGSVQPTHDEGSEWDGTGDGHDVAGHGPYGTRWQYLYDRFGIAQITGYTSPTEVTAIVLRRIPDSLDTVPSWRWAKGAFSDAEGWPNLVFTWNQRLCFWKSFELYASVAGDFLNFQQYLTSGYQSGDLAFRLVLEASDPPLWVLVDRDPIIGTASHEYAIQLINAASGVVPENLKAVKQSAYGSKAVWPVEPGSSVVFVQRGGKQLREAEYDFGRDRYLASNINRWARHIAGPGLIQLGHQASPEELLFGVRGDGQLVLRSYDPEQQVKGFSRRVLGQGGTILSAVSIPSEDGTVDEIWALCDWGGAKSVQQMQSWWTVGTPIAEAFFVDDALTGVFGEPTATVTGLQHLAGAEVSILADGGVCVRQTVPESGTITIEYPASRITVGRGYTARMRVLPAEVKDPTGQTAMGKIKRLINLVLRLIDSSGIKINVGMRDEILLDRPLSAAMDTAAPLFNGDTERLSVAGDYNRPGQYEIISDEPLPCFVIAAMPRYEVADR
ncbi:MAG: hypothetical protein V4564_20175 [Pseudomonadota bacterium]